jgi:hypothetical protein
VKFCAPTLRALLLSVPLLSAELGRATPASAQEGGTRRQAAEALFQQGRELLSRGDAANACAKFEASEQLDAGIGTLLFLGQCYDQLGRSASAWRAFSRAADLAHRKGDAEREQLARIRVSALEPTVPELRVRVAPGTRALTAVAYTLNGSELSAEEIDRPLRVDPGRALVRVTAPGHEPWEVTLGILQGPSTAVIDVPELAPARSESPPIQPLPSPRVGTSAAAPLETPRPAPALSSSGSGLRTASLVLASVGLASAGVGTYFALHAVSEAKRSKSVQNCPLPGRCYASGIQLRDAARSDAHVADLTIGIGASLFVGGVVLYLLAPASERSELGALRATRVSIARSASSIVWEGTW